MRALVTGATGFLGHHVMRALIQRGVEVRALIRPTSDRATLADLPVSHVFGDLLDPASLNQACRDVEWVIHVAADYRLWVPDPRRMSEVNVTGTENVIAAAAEAGVARIVYTSTAATVACGHDNPGTEEAFVQPEECRCAYQKSKVLAEQAVWRWIHRGAPVTIVNPSTLIGPVDRRPSPTGRLIVDFVSGRIPAYLDAQLNLIDVRDAAEGHWLAATRGRVGERYVLAHQNRSVGEFLKTLAEVCDRRAPRWRVPYAVAYAAGCAGELKARWLGGEPQATRGAVRMAGAPMRYNSMKAVKELGLPQMPLRSSVLDALRWFEENGYVNQKGRR